VVGAIQTTRCRYINTLVNASTRLPPTITQYTHDKPIHPGHTLHFDSVDPSSTQDHEAQPLTPLVSTVTYLTTGIGGPTIVTDQGVNETQSLARCTEY
jgi:hypothetical protein